MLCYTLGANSKLEFRFFCCGLFCFSHFFFIFLLSHLVSEVGLFRLDFFIVLVLFDIVRFGMAHQVLLL